MWTTALSNSKIPSNVHPHAATSSGKINYDGGKDGRMGRDFNQIAVVCVTCETKRLVKLGLTTRPA